MNLRGELLKRINDDSRVSVGTSIVEQHGHDLTHHTPHDPDVVVFPKSTEEVRKVLAFANDHGVPVTPCGVMTSLEGHTIPVHGGISLDLTLMNEVMEVRPDDFLVRVGPGVTRTQLNKALKPYGLQFPLDPGADATVGGMAATNASGTTAVRYGVMRSQVLDLEVVLADGSVIRTGGMAMKSSAGYNLTGLFVGSEGTLGVITELTLRVHGIPESTVAARASFEDVFSACNAAYAIIGSGIPIGRVELVDEYTIEAVNRLKGTNYDAKPTLFLEFHGSREAVQSDVQLGKQCCFDEGGLEFVFEADEKARHKLWEARHDAALAIMQTAPGKKMKITDVCMPISELPGAIQYARELVSSNGIYGAILGHVGDGNYHVEFMVDPTDVDEMQLAERINREIVQYALERGGTCTGEHGVGIGKSKYLKQEHGDTIQWMRGLKRLFDVNGIMNPGKLFVPED